MADNVTLSGTVDFSSIDGSAQDHDHAVNGVFTVDDGNLTISGKVNCNDDGPGNASACAMKFAVSGNFTMTPGSGLFAENRKGNGTGGNITINAGGNVLLQGATVSQPGAIISSGSESSNDNGGQIAITAGGTAKFETLTIVSAGSKGGNSGNIDVTSGGKLEAGGFIVSGPSTNLSGGSGQQKGGNVSLVSNAHGEPAVTITETALVASQGENPGAGTVKLEGCGIEVRGAVSSLSKKGNANAVLLRSGTAITIDSRDLGSSSGNRKGLLITGTTNDDGSGDSIRVYARDNVQIFGPSAAGSVASLTNVSKDDAGSITVLSLAGTVTGTAYVAKAGDTSAGAGGSVTIAAKNNVTLDNGTIRANGKSSSRGGAVSVRSHSGAISWQLGTGDVRPTGSSVPAAQRGTITLTYCTTVNTSGSTFPTNGPPVGPFPTTVQTCSPAAPSLPAGNPALPDCNDPPVAVNDAYTVAEGGTLNVPAPGVLANDSDPDGDPITAVLVTGPAHGTVTLNPNGSFTYVHDGSETLTDSFTYKANDGSLDSNVATVTFTVTPVNDPPVAHNDAYTVAEGGTLNVAAPGVLANDTDPDSSLTASVVTGPAHGSLVLNPNGSFTYIHDGSETTSDSFTYQASDGFLTSTATVNITITPVNDPPVAVNDAYTVAEGGTLNVAAPGVLGNDTDPDSSLTASLVSGPAHGTLTLNANGSFTYVHDGSETTTDSFVYKASDGSLSSNATVNITITPVNDPPVANNDAYTVAEGGTLNVPAPGVLGNDTDPDSSLTASVVTGPAHGTLTLNPNGSFSYVHDGSETTTDSFVYQASDGTSTSNATVTITITPVNDPPVANNDAYTVAEGGTLNVPAPGVLGNDTDPDSTMTAVLVSGPAHGSLTLNADGSFSYVHDGSETTSDSFTYKANDGTVDSNVATVTITVSPVDDAPVAVNDAYSVAEGGTLNVAAPGVLGNDTDVDTPAGSLNAVLVSGPAHGTLTFNGNGSFSYAHDGSETTTDSFTYKANDGTSDSNVATVTITITPVDDAPVAINDAYVVSEGGTLTIPAPGVLGNDTDADSPAASLSAVLVSGPAHGSLTLNADGSFTYTHDGSETLTDSFTYKVSDGTSFSNVATVALAVTPVNDAPVANPDSYSFPSGTHTVPAPGVLGNDTDVDSPTLTAILVSGPTAGTLVLNPNGSFTFSYTGPPTTVTFTYKANDSVADSNVTTVTITILNQAPVANPDSFAAVGNTELRVGTGGTLYPAAVVAGSVLANDSDPEGDTLTVTGVATPPAHGTVSINPNGSFNYLPNAGYIGPDSFQYTVSDGANTATGTVTLSISTRVWYVRNDALAGDGRSPSPFNTLAAAASAVPPGDIIYVHRGDGTPNGQNSGITLLNNQQLIGEGVALVVGPYTLFPAGLKPTIGNSGGTGVTMGNASVVRGLTVSASGVGISSSAKTGGTIGTVDVTGGTDGISISTGAGTYSLTDVNLTPGANGLVINGGTPTVNASNLDVTTTGGKGIFGNAGALNVTAGTDGSTVTTTGSTAVDLSNMALGVSLRSVSAAADANGILVNNTTGSFTVTGSGATAGSGGTISNMTTRGASFTTASNVSLSNMLFTANGTVNGVAANICGDTFNGTNTGCNAGIHLVGVSGVSLSNVLVTGGAQIGINGNGVSNLTMTNVEVANNGNETSEHGVQFVNLSGTATITGSNFHNNFHRQFTVQNSAGSLNINIAGSNFSSVVTPTGAQGALISGHGTASITSNVSSSTFHDNFSSGYFSDGADSASLNVTVSGSTFTTNAQAVFLGTAGASTLTYNVNGNTSMFSLSSPFTVQKSGTGNVTGSVTNNVLGATGVPNSTCSVTCDAINLTATGSGTFQTTVSGNTVRQITSRGITVSVGSGSVNALAKIFNNDLADSTGSAQNGIFVQSGTAPTDTTSVCSSINNNLIAGAYASGQIRVRNRFPTTTFRIPGYPGAGNDTTAVQNYLISQNPGVTTATATINGNIFGGGPACF
jgi:VCBS repeat-containing protein